MYSHAQIGIPISKAAGLPRLPIRCLRHDTPATLIKLPPSVHLSSPLQQQHRRKHTSSTVCSASNTVKVVEGFWPVLVQAWNSDPASVMLGIGTCIIAAAISALLVAAVPALLAFRRTMTAMEGLAVALTVEVPDTAAAMRLSGMEIAECFEEVSSLGGELSEGIRASARMIIGAEQGIKDGLTLAGKAVTECVVPAVKKTAPKAKEMAQAALKERAALDHTEPTLRELASATKSATQRLRTALAAASVAQQTAGHVGRIRGRRRSKQRALDPMKSMDAVLLFAAMLAVLK